MLDRVVQFDISYLHEQELRDGALERGEFETGIGFRVAESVLELGCELVEKGLEEVRVVCGAGVEVVDLKEEGRGVSVCMGENRRKEVARGDGAGLTLWP